LPTEAAAGADHGAAPQGRGDEGREGQVADRHERPQHRPADRERGGAQGGLGGGPGPDEERRRREPQGAEGADGHRGIDDLLRAGQDEQRGDGQRWCGGGVHRYSAASANVSDSDGWTRRLSTMSSTVRPLVTATASTLISSAAWRPTI